MKKKKVLHIVEAFGGGVFTVLNDLINELSGEYEIVIAYALRKQTPKNFKKYFNKNVRFIEVKNFIRKISPIKDFKALIEIRNIVKEEKPDIIHLHSSKAGVLGRIGIHNKNIKMFYNPHGFSFLKLDDSKVKRIIYRMIEKFAAIVNHKCTIVGCSKGEYDVARRINSNSICINNGIDISKLNEEIKELQTKDINYKNLNICTIGRISFQKNPKMFNQVAKEFPNYKFTWIGDGEMRKELTAPNITVTGWKTRKEVLRELNNNDIFLLVSLWEGLPISLLEAMLLGKICLVTDCVGNKDVIKDGENGYIINECNFKNIINSLNKDNINQILIKSKQEVMEIYNIKRVAKEYSNVYKGDDRL